jgi:uncharacterized membrane protein YkgB
VSLFEIEGTSPEIPSGGNAGVDGHRSVDPAAKPDGIIINEVQLLLAEKRTSLAAMRTGIAVFTLPLSVLSILIATSRYYDITHVMPLLVPLLVICGALVILGCYLVIRAIIRIRHQERLILAIKGKNGWIAEFLA